MLNELIKVTQLIKVWIQDLNSGLPDFKAHLFTHSKKCWKGITREQLRIVESPDLTQI